MHLPRKQSKAKEKGKDSLSKRSLIAGTTVQIKGNLESHASILVVSQSDTNHKA